MNDSELITVMRESVAGVRSATTAEQIVTRGRAVRTRRRMTALTGATAVVAAAVLALTALLPGRPPASPHAGVELAAWTVIKQADGNVRVTIRDLRDPAGLQRKLRADGVPAAVSFAGQVNPACRPAGGRTYNLFTKVVRAAHHLQLPRRGTIVVIHPSALPRHTGLLLAAGFAKGPRHGTARLISIAGALVHPSHQCTGS